MPVTQIPEGFSHYLCSSPLGPIYSARECKYVLRKQETSNTRQCPKLGETAPQLIFTVNVLSPSPNRAVQFPARTLSPGALRLKTRGAVQSATHSPPTSAPGHPEQGHRHLCECTGVCLDRPPWSCSAAPSLSTSRRAAGEKAQRCPPISVNRWVCLCPGNGLLARYSQVWVLFLWPTKHF